MIVIYTDYYDSCCSTIQDKRARPDGGRRRRIRKRSRSWTGTLRLIFLRIKIVFICKLINQLNERLQRIPSGLAGHWLPDNFITDHVPFDLKLVLLLESGHPEDVRLVDLQQFRVALGCKGIRGGISSRTKVPIGPKDHLATPFPPPNCETLPTTFPS